MTDITTNVTLSEELEATVIASIEKESAELTRLCNLVSDAAKIEMVSGKLVSDSRLTSDELEILAMRIPSECLRIQTSINRYMANNVFRDLEIEAKVTQLTTALMGEKKGNADERKRRAELEVLKKRTISLTETGLPQAHEFIRGLGRLFWVDDWEFIKKRCCQFVCFRL